MSYTWGNYCGMKHHTKPSGLELEVRCARILPAYGWLVKRTPRSREGGIDLIATKVDAVGIGQTIYVQCKDHTRPVGVEVVREFVGVLPVGKNIQLILVSPAGVTADAAWLAKQRDVKIWDEPALQDLESTVKPDEEAGLGSPETKLKREELRD